MLGTGKKLFSDGFALTRFALVSDHAPLEATFNPSAPWVRYRDSNQARREVVDGLAPE